MVTLKELEKRLEEMSTLFTSKMTTFQAELNSNKVSDDDVEDNLAVKFNEFKIEVQKSLEKLRNELQNCNEDISISENKNSLLLHGIPEDNVDTYDSVLKIINEKLHVNITKLDFNYCHRLGKKKDSRLRRKPRPIVVNFIHRWQRNIVYFAKKNLKGCNVLITEVLTTRKLELYKQVRDKVGNDCWTSNCNIFALVNNKKCEIRKIEDLSV